MDAAKDEARKLEIDRNSSVLGIVNDIEGQFDDLVEKAGRI